MLRVFIADDSPLICERLVEVISSVAGTELVGQAADAPGAVETIRQTRPDVAILDIRMPGRGLHVLEAVKGGESPPVVIMLTAFPYPQYRQRCLEAGAEHFLDKATEFDQVAKVLAGLVGNGSLGARLGEPGLLADEAWIGDAKEVVHIEYVEMFGFAIPAEIDRRSCLATR